MVTPAGTPAGSGFAIGASQDGFAVRVAVDDAALRAALGRLMATLSDLTPVFDEIGAALVTATSLRFDAERGPDGQPWKPLAPATLLRRRKAAGGVRRPKAAGGVRRPEAAGDVKILQDAGHLKGGLTHRATADAVEVGADRVYARIHQFGGTAGRGHAVTIPARPFLGLDAADEADILDILHDHLAAAGGGVP